MPKLFRLIKLLFFGLIFFLPAVSRAQSTPLGIATTYTIDDPEAVDGDLLCFTESTGKLVRCNKPYDEKIFGVLTATPQVVLRDGAKSQPVIREGRASINVTTKNGTIKPGDYITTSDFPGRGQKATELTGYVVGRSLGTFSEKEGRVEAALNIGPTVIFSKGNILDQLGLALVKNVQKPEGAALFIRYVTAGLTAILMTLFAFNNFAKNITKGIESVGRNPLARHQIQFIVIINIVLIAAVTLGGLILSLAIIRF